MRVLVVDDHQPLRHLFAVLLTAEGAEVAQAGTGREAVALACLERFDAVLTDLGLPDVDGELMIKTLLAAASTNRPAVAVISGRSEPHLSRARAAGADAVFRKPVDWDDIITFLGDIGAPAVRQVAREPVLDRRPCGRC